jgi:hypothetical protein
MQDVLPKGPSSPLSTVPIGFDGPGITHRAQDNDRDRCYSATNPVFVAPLLMEDGVYGGGRENAMPGVVFLSLIAGVGLT